MAKRYIIEELQATHWSVRLRDPESGEVIEVPLEPGAPWPGKIRTDATTHDGGEAKAGDTRTEIRAPEVNRAERPPEANRAERPTPAANRAERPAARKARKDKGNKGAARVTAPAELKEVMSSPALRSRPIDEETVSAEDAAAFTKMQTMLRRARGRRAGKRGELGWDETTDAGRSGLIARFNSGAFKILHAGGGSSGAVTRAAPLLPLSLRAFFAAGRSALFVSRAGRSTLFASGARVSARVSSALASPPSCVVASVRIFPGQGAPGSSGTSMTSPLSGSRRRTDQWVA